MEISAIIQTLKLNCMVYWGMTLLTGYFIVLKLAFPFLELTRSRIQFHLAAQGPQRI